MQSKADSFELYTNIYSSLLNALTDKSIDYLKELVSDQWLLDFNNNSLLPDECISLIDDLSALAHLNNVAVEVKGAPFFDNLSSTSIDTWLLQNDIPYDQVLDILNKLLSDISAVENVTTVSDNFKAAYNILDTERQLLADIKAVDVNGEFYYNAPVESSLAIEFNDSNPALNTLMNPLTCYDINNVNNNFVISKLDIDYLDTGLQISRSSRIR